ncbi:hypothetical protein CBER1_04900 [Cercospora berteroae]|uniref:F-box domain-containing protein n=1 Tax=Cercospora berteroae TaxID=357750 RepID=A0A2S6BS45_9PEZI|nr:hypothetical protein CBER1_04900 [Cercospora berteroae]
MADSANLNVITILDAQYEEIDGKAKELEEKMALLDRQRKYLEAKRSELEPSRVLLKDNIAMWYSNRTFKLFLQLPLEIREMIYAYRIPTRMSYHTGYRSPVARISKQLREEFLSWLAWNRPMIWSDTTRFVDDVYPRSGHHRLAEKRMWSILAAKMLSHVKMIDIFRDSHIGGTVRIVVASGELRFHGLSKGRAESKMRNRAQPRLQLVATTIAKEGVGLKNWHFSWIHTALSTNKSLADLEAEMQHDIARS